MKSTTVVVNLSVRRRLVEVDSCWVVDNYLVNSCLVAVVVDSCWQREEKVELGSCYWLVEVGSCYCCNIVVGKDSLD